MKRLILVCLCAAFSISATQEAFAWGAVRGPYGGAALKWTPKMGPGASLEAEAVLSW